MNFRHQGNGDRKVEVEFIDHPGYVLVAPKNPAPFPAAIALVINAAVVDWMREQKNIRVRAVLPINESGNTVAVHIWYDRADGVA
jgi:hypothetical protein